MSGRRRGQHQREDIEFDFFSFPAYFGFALGGLTCFFLLLFFGSLTIGITAIFVIFLFGSSFGTAHLVSHWFRRRVMDKRLQRENEDERERRALVAREAASLDNEQSSHRRRRRRR